MKTEKQTLLEDALGSLLYKFFNGILTTHESEESLVSMLWRAVKLYRETGIFNTAIVVCPPYSPDYKSLDVGRISVTALRAIELYKFLKIRLGQHISYSSSVCFTLQLFNHEEPLCAHIGAKEDDVKRILSHNVSALSRMIRKTGILPDSFKADLFVTEGNQEEWRELYRKSQVYVEGDGYKGTEPFLHPDTVYGLLGDWYTKVLNTPDKTVHRRMFLEQEAPVYLSTGPMLRKKIHPGVIQIDVGSNPELSRLNLWQPEGEGDTPPSLIRIKNPSCLDP